MRCGALSQPVVAILAAALLIGPAWGQPADWQAGIARISTRKDLARAPGTAFVVEVRNGNGYLVTSAHVVEGDDDPQVEFAAEPEKVYRATVREIEAGDERGLALLVVANPPAGVRPIPEAVQPFGLQAAVSVAGYPSSLNTFSVVDTAIAAIRGRDVFLSRETDEGFSGGPVVGIVYGREGGFGKALGSSSIKPFIEGNSLTWAKAGATTQSTAGTRDKVQVTALNATKIQPLALDGAWPNGSNIKIGFLNGSVSQKQKVEQVAKEWLRYANLTYTFSNTPTTADARIIFSDNNIASWSFRGTEAHDLPPTCPTMTLVQVANDSIISPYDRAAILHEFGHLLGLLDEIQNPNANIPWRQEIRANPVTYAYINQIKECRAPLNQPVTYQESLPHYRPFDPKSIMMAPISKEYLTKDVSFGGAGELSTSDKEFVAQLYPKL